jgi:hypothetical protein
MHMCKFICIHIFICSCMHAWTHNPSCIHANICTKWSWVHVLVHIFLTKLWCVHRCEHTILIASMWTRITWKYSIIQICIHRYSSICVYVPCVNSFVHIHGCRLRMHKSMFPYIHASTCAWVLMHVVVWLHWWASKHSPTNAFAHAQICLCMGAYIHTCYQKWMHANE